MHFGFLTSTVADVMTHNVYSVGLDTTLSELEELFEQHDFNGVPVLDETGNLLGMVTKFDLLRAFGHNTGSIVPHYDDIMAQSVHSVMSRKLQTVDSAMPLARVLELLIETRHKSFPVVAEEGRLLGMIAREDVLQALLRATRTED